MKKTKKLKRIIALVLSFVILLVSLEYIGRIVRVTDSDLDIANINAFHQFPEDTAEVIIYGSSHPWDSIKPSLMYEEYGIGSVNFSTRWERLNTTLLFLDDSFKTQSPKVALIELHKPQVLVDEDMGAEVYYTRYLNCSVSSRYNYLKQVFGVSPDNWLRWASYLFPIIEFHDNLSSIKKSTAFSDFTGKVTHKKHNFYYTFGYKDDYATKEIDLSFTGVAEMDEDTIAELDAIVKKCEDNNTIPVFFTVPYAGDIDYTASIAEYMSENDLKYLDMTKHYDDMGLDAATDFRNNGHMNDCGADKATRYLADYLLTEVDDLTDMRTVPDNYWETVISEANAADTSE